MKWFLDTAIIISIIISLSLLPYGTSAVRLQLFLAESVDVTEGESVTLPCSVSAPPDNKDHLSIAWFIVSETSEDRIPIYTAYKGNFRPNVAVFVGDEKTGDCSIRLPKVSRHHSHVFMCKVYCRSCDADNWMVTQTVKLNVTAAVETSPTPGLPHSWVMGLPGVISVVVGLGAVAAIVFIIKKCNRLPRSCLHSRRSVVVKGNVNGESLKMSAEPLMVNAEPLMVNTESPVMNAESLMMNAESLMMNAESLMMTGKSLMMNAESPVVNAESPVVNAEPLMVNAESPVVNAESPVVNAEPLKMNENQEENGLQDPDIV